MQCCAIPRTQTDSGSVFDSGDHLHANDAGDVVSAETVPLSFSSALQRHQILGQVGSDA
jgi:hypothetical protein